MELSSLPQIKDNLPFWSWGVQSKSVSKRQRQLSLHNPQIAHFHTFKHPRTELQWQIAHPRSLAAASVAPSAIEWCFPRMQRGQLKYEFLKWDIPLV